MIVNIVGLDNVINNFIASFNRLLDVVLWTCVIEK